MYRISKKYICFFVISLVVFLSGCNNFNNKNNELVSVTGFYFDTTIQIKAVHENADEILADSLSLCADLEKIFSRTDEESELYQINHRTENIIEISEELAEVICLGLEYSEKTDGIFDITICPVSELWDFKSDDPKIPDADAIEAALEKVDYTTVHLDGNTLTFDRDDTMLDLGAVAKGYAADMIKEFLISSGVQSGFINMGGNVQTIGSKVDGTPWTIGIQKPFSDRGTILETVDVTDQSVVSAGIYERYFEIDGKQYYHILDARTGYPAETDLNQVTVVCDESAVGDVISTSCLLMGEENAKAFLEEIGFSNVWLHLGDQCAMISQ